MVNPLMSLLRASMHFGDGLKDVGFQEAIQVQLSREDGLRLLKIVTHCTTGMVEHYAQDKFTTENGYNRLHIANLSFSWPVADFNVEVGQSLDGLRARDITPYPKRLN
jgi:hypothetical protein